MRKNFTLLLSLFLLPYYLLAQVPVNYYQSVETLTGTTLQAALHEIIDQHTVISYSNLWTAFASTDATQNGKVWDIYSDIPGQTPPYVFSFGTNQCGNYSKEGDCYNREHSFPQSWFNELSPMVSDLFQIYPTDGYVNGKRANYPYGETNNATWISLNGSKLGNCSTTGYTGIVFEPIDDYKGDLARTYFYMATRYYNEDANWPGSDMVVGSQPKKWAMDMLLRWHQNDPVSPKEVDRNNAIYVLQKNRNPFIDHPEFANSIWGEETPQSTVKEPDNHVNDFGTSFIRLSWNEATGEHLPDGYLIFIGNNGYEEIPVPQDGVSPTTYSNCQNVPYGVKECTFKNLVQQQPYYFKIYSYSGTGSLTDYKTDGEIVKTMIKTN